MTALQRHYFFLRLYGQRTDMDAVKSAHQFLWEEDDKAGHEWGGPTTTQTWEQRLAKRYYDRLYREYALADMTRYREGAIGLRWRTESEVFDGKGQFVCGNKACSSDQGLQSFELQFSYVEHGVSKAALVKLRACPECAAKLNYRKRKDEERSEGERRREERKEERKEAKRRKEERKRRNSKHDRHEKKKRRKEDRHSSRRHRSRSRSRERDESSDDSDGAGDAGRMRRDGDDGRGADPRKATAHAPSPHPSASGGLASPTEADHLEARFQRYCDDLLR